MLMSSHFVQHIHRGSMNMNRHPLAVLLVLGLGANPIAARDAAPPQTLASDEEAAGRRLRRNPQTSPIGQRQMQDVLVEDDAPDAEFGDTFLGTDLGEDGQAPDVPLGGQNLCKSIIAIGGWRRDQGESERRLHNADAIQRPDDGAGFVDLGYGDIDLIGDDNATSSVENITIPYEDDPLLPQFDTDEEFVCELQDGSTLPLQGTQEQFVELRTLLNNGTLISAQSSVEADHIISSVSDLEDGDGVAFSSTQEVVTLPPGPVKVIDNEEDEYNQRRRLNRYNGDKKFLIVRVKDKDDRVVPENANVISNKWFGTSGDPVNMKRGFQECSFNKFRATNDYGNGFDYSKLSAPGVVDVEINIKLTTSTQEQIRYAAVVAVQQKLQMHLPGPFHHVVFIVPSCHPVGTTCSFAAYAYVRHWLSLFIEDNWMYAAVQMHEIGHNLNLAHSGGTDGRTYTDHSCLMGNPLWEDDVGRMCFNPVKNFQINNANGWYNAQHIQVWNSGTAGGTKWSGKLLGVARAGNNPANDPIVLKLETGAGADWFVGYNHAVGPNSHTDQGRNRVTVYKVASGDGMHYSHSHLKAVLRGNQRGTVQNWRGTGMDLVIKVKTINVGASTGYADVDIMFGPQTPPPTPKPSPSPTKQPITPPPTSPPTTSPSLSPTKQPTPNPTSPPTASPSHSPTTPPTLTSAPSLTGAPSDSPTTSSPTAAPTSKPTVQPTARPTNQCGNGICDGKESGSSCPSDCIARAFTATNANGALSSAGQMFTMRAKKDVKIRALQVVGKQNARSRCRVFTRRGGYKGHIRKQGSWTKLLDKWVTMKRGRTLNLGDLNSMVTLNAGETQAFYVHCSKGMLYAKGYREGNRYTGNAALDIHQGVGTKNYFGPVVRKSKFRGTVLYVESPN